jgi:hypothetical protein
MVGKTCPPYACLEIESFIKTHSHLATSLSLSEAPFWTSSQAAFLCEEIINDAGWAEVIVQLNASFITYKELPYTIFLF